DSLEVERLLADLEAWLGASVDARLVSECGTLIELANAIAVGKEAPGRLEPSHDQKRFERFVNPFLGERLRWLHFDREFVSGQGCVLRDDAGRSYLDFLAGYGALPFGHNPEAIWRRLREV